MTLQAGRYYITSQLSHLPLGFPRLKDGPYDITQNVVTVSKANKTLNDWYVRVLEDGTYRLQITGLYFETWPDNGHVLTRGHQGDPGNWVITKSKKGKHIYTIGTDKDNFWVVPDKKELTEIVISNDATISDVSKAFKFQHLEINNVD